MSSSPVLISTGKLTRDSLAGQVAIVTGAGHGIGIEAARALAWLGAKVVIAEIDKTAGKDAAQKINEEMGSGNALFMHADVGDEGSIEHLKREALHQYGKVDIVLNNATIAVLGAVKDRPIEEWDRSYSVNLRGPVMLARAFLPDMLKRNYGVLVFVSSFGGAYMAAYETFKRAQVTLADTLADELEETGVIAFTIGPGQVLTQTLEDAAKKLAPMYGKTPEEFINMNQGAIIPVEAAGAGFAAAIALAPQFKGLETTSLQALIAAEIKIPEETGKESQIALSEEQMNQALQLCRAVRRTLAEQSEGWKKRNLFERKWVINDFNRNTGLPIDKWLDALSSLEQSLEAHDLTALKAPNIQLGKIANYWKHQTDLAKGYTKNPEQLQEQLKILGQWWETTEKLANLLTGKG
jgi:NAD(P)-dependent dehydrogenase (short-subunit alcohol dehydrogenase family)